MGGEAELSGLAAAELESRIAEFRVRMRPLEAELAELRAEREVLETELRRRERLSRRDRRAGAREAARSGEALTVLELVSSSDEGSLDGFVYTLKTGGEVRLGFAGARAQSLTFTDGRQIAQASDLTQAARLYAAGWDLGSPGRPGVRVHFPGTRQEKLVDAGDVFARPNSDDAGGGPS